MEQRLQSPRQLSSDPVMRILITKHQIKEYWGNQPDLFLNLIETVIGQQLSIKAADTIFKRFLAIFKTNTPKPKEVLAIPIEKIRSVGLSGSKASYVRNIAEAVISGTLPLDWMEKMTDEDVKKELLKIKGLGPWSAEMFLIFSLKRPDIFSVGDLGLRSAIEKLYGIKRDNLKEIEKLSQTWRPYRSLACRYLWASLEKI